MSKSIASKLILKSPCLPLLENCKSMAELKQIHALIFRTGLSDDNLASTKILQICGLSKTPDFNYARLVFDQIGAPNTFTWNTMIKAHSKARNSNEVIDLYTEMLKRSNKPNGVTLSFALKACSNLGNFQSLMGIHCQIFKSGFHSDVFALNSLVHAYSLCGCVDFARRVFDELPERDLISWTVVIGNYVRSNRPKEAIDLFFLMREENVQPDEVVAVYLFNACSQLGDLNLGRRLEGLVRETCADYNSYVLNSLIDMYAKCGSIGDARKVFDQMSERTIVSWNSIVAGYARCGNMESAKRLFGCIPQKNNVSWSTLLNGFVQNGAFKEALMVFREMQAKGVTPNDASITGVITACSHLGALELGRKVHAGLDERRVQSDTVLSTALVDMYAKCGCLDVSCLLFDGIVKKNLISYNAMITGLAIHGKASNCIDVFSEMVRNGIRPDSITFVGILSGCAHAGWLKEGKEYFDQMSTVYGIAPRVEHCSCMVHLMGQSGNIDQASEFIKASPVKPDVVMWGALLNACKMHGHVELGEFAAKQILELDPGHRGAFVLLSSIYAAAHNWSKVMEVRKMMKECGIDNRTGSSWIEIDGTVHEFVAGDDSHPEIDEIHSVLGALDFRS
ncbi:hypothetical protein MRB53_033760 [Persea americana]|uniref:Uncharacterized protein n=1 Tax=Persea americana TaxID=3435 RepID=A0ACC2KVP2_PERAE|nr:hypothetical protein MRB53_033760 [Persea americana]